MKRQWKRLVRLSVTIFLSVSFTFVFISESFFQPTTAGNTNFSYLNIILNSVRNEIILLTSTESIVFTENYSILNGSKTIITDYCADEISKEQI
jgi:hypothetical protein